MGVASYNHFIPEELRDELPGEEALREQFQKGLSQVKNPIGEKISKLKALVNKLNNKAADLEKNPEITKKIFQKIARPLIKGIDKKLSAINPSSQNSKANE